MASSLVAADDPLVHVAFSRDATHLVAATSSGIRVFSCSPLEHVFTRSGFTSPDGSGAAGEVTAADVVPSSGSPSSSPVAVVFGDTVRYWSEAQGQMMPGADLTSPSTHGAVRAVRHVGGYALVAGEDRVALHEISEHGVAKQIMEVETGPNPTGACALAMDDGWPAGYVLACPQPTVGRVEVWHKGRDAPVDVLVHDISGVACLELSSDGRLLAAADSVGMTVLIFSTSDGLTRQKLIVNSAMTSIHCMAFSHDTKLLAVSSDKVAVHLFIIKVYLTPWTPPPDDDGLEAIDANTISPYLTLDTGAFLMAHFTASRSVERFHLDDGVRYQVAFGQEANTILIIGMDGSFYRTRFHPVNGSMNQIIEHKNLVNTT